MSSGARRIGWALGGTFAVLFPAAAVFSVLGSAVVIDRHGQVVSAAIVTGDGRRQNLHALPGGLFYAAPGLEGTIELGCRDGSRPQWGYVTWHMHTGLSVEPGPGCGRIVDAAYRGVQRRPLPIESPVWAGSLSLQPE